MNSNTKILSAALIAGFLLVIAPATAFAQLDFNDPVYFGDSGSFGGGLDYNNPSYFGDTTGTGGGLDYNNPSYFGDSGSSYGDPNLGYGVTNNGGLDYNNPSYFGDTGSGGIDYNNPSYFGDVAENPYNSQESNLGYGVTNNTPDLYNSSCDCYVSTYGTSGGVYGSMPIYAQQAIPTFAAQYVPGYTSASYSSGGSTYRAPTYSSSGSVYRPNTPSFGTAGSQTQNQSQSSYNSNPNTNVNTNTNNPTAVATNGPITNNNNSSAVTGPVTVTNNINVVPVSHAQPQYNAQYNLPITPSCTINASNYYTYGAYNNQPTTLSWSSQNATSAYITPQVGTVAPSGATTVYPNGYTTYTLTISGVGGTATCQTTANYGYNNYNYVQPTYVPPTVYTQSAAPAVSLTQIPYTGFDYGPVGNAMYWISLLAFAVAAGYLVVYYRGGALAIAHSMFRSRRNDSYDFSDEIQEEVAATAVVAPIVAAPAPVVSPITVRELPMVENHRITTDSMIIDRSFGAAPRIVIARG